MAASPDTIDIAVDVLIVGAGPVGLTLANVLGLQGVRTLIAEERDTLIDYPRGVGLDDESLRTFQSIGLVDAVLPHTVPNQILRFFDANRRLLVEMAPPDARFGWPKRNGFVQPDDCFRGYRQLHGHGHTGSFDWSCCLHDYRIAGW